MLRRNALARTKSQLDEQKRIVRDLKERLAEKDRVIEGLKHSVKSDGVEEKTEELTGKIQELEKEVDGLKKDKEKAYQEQKKMVEAHKEELGKLAKAHAETKQKYENLKVSKRKAANDEKPEGGSQKPRRK